MEEESDDDDNTEHAHQNQLENFSHPKVISEKTESR